MSSNIIHLLPDALANQIAAGEVVQRPASAVKELLENSIDAGATNIQLRIKEGGKALIQVIDNGKGMSEIDARMCFERHATSKLKTTEDLFNINTYGFRGEAMASIAAVAHVELKSKTNKDELGQVIKIHGSEIIEQTEDAMPDGTSITIKNLFFNVPARRKFLKSNPVETKHIVDEFQRVALANPKLTMALHQNDLEMYNLGEGNLSKRIVQLLGKNYQQQLIDVEEVTDFVSIKGYIGKPEAAKKTRGDQFFFANDRFIKHHYLHHAVSDAYDGLIPDGSHPFYVLFITIAPEHLDVNVHPTKTEVKFDDERSIYAIMKSAVKRALGVNNVSPSIDFDQNINFGVETTGKRDYGTDKAPFEIPDHLKTNYSSVPASSPREKSNQQNWGNLYSGFEQTENSIPSRETAIEAFQIESTINQRDEGEQQEAFESSEVSSFEKKDDQLFELHGKFIVSQVKSGMMMINKQAALESILYEKYLKAAENKNGSSQQCLFPQTVELNPADYHLVLELEEEIKGLGFLFNAFGGNSFIIEGVPADLNTGNEKELFEGLIDQFKINKSDLKLSASENLSRSLAKRSVTKSNKPLSKLEMTNLIDKLFACKNPNYSPYGEPTFVILDLPTLDGFFK